MNIFPAIDLCGGKVVRLFKGDYGQVTEYGLDAVTVAKNFYNCGARFLHIVDLDGAKDGSTRNFKLIGDIAGSTGMFCEVGGGIRTMESIDAYLNSGAGRVILGTAAINNPELLEEALAKYGERIAVGVDTKDGKVAVKGWTEITETDGIGFCAELYSKGVKNIIYTDISKDGTLSGTNLDAYGHLAEIKGLNVTASGGISSLDELVILNKLGTSAAILGKALYEGVLDLRAVIERVG